MLDAATRQEEDSLGLRGDRRQYPPRSGALPWWEDFTKLLTQVLVDAAGLAPRVNGRVSDPGAEGLPAAS